VYRNRFSLASLLLLTAVVAVYFAAIGSARDAWDRFDTHTELVATCIIVGGIVGLAIGSFIGWHQIGRVYGVVIGVGAGIAAGIAGGVLMAMPDTFWTIAAGCAVLLLLAGAIRFLSTRPEE